MFSPNACVCSIAFKVTFDPCPSKISKFLLVREIPPCTNLLKKNKNSLKRKIGHLCFSDYACVLDL